MDGKIRGFTDSAGARKQWIGAQANPSFTYKTEARGLVSVVWEKLP